MLVRAVQERHETKQSQVNASSSATTNNQNVTSNAAEAYNPGYQRAFMEHKDVAKVEDETHRKGRRASLDDDLGGWRLEDAPPPMYEMVERNEK